MHWTSEEVAATVAAYLDMLGKELAGLIYSKAEYRRALQQKIDRSEGAIEFKHCNISAALIELGYPCIRGYQPRSNFQRQALFEELTRQIAAKPELEIVAAQAVELPAATPHVDGFDKVRVEAPPLELKAPKQDTYRPPALSQRDYLAREARNRSLGLAGEEFVVNYEQWRLTQLGKRRLAERVEHTSALRGDGAGYDVLSFEENGKERFIEVKTTAYAIETPFFISHGEVAFANHHEAQFSIYRVFEFRRAPRLFELWGRPDRHCRLEPTNYRASFSWFGGNASAPTSFHPTE